MMIFHSYVKLPEGTTGAKCICLNSADPLGQTNPEKPVLVLLFVATAHAFFLSHGEAFLELHRDDGCSIARVEY